MNGLSGLSALLYLEARMMVNRIRQIMRRPSRLILWALFFLWFGSFIFFKMAHGSANEYSTLFPHKLQLLFVFVPAIYVVILGAQILIGSGRPPAAFAYPADARFLFGSRLPPRLVIFWLQLREAFFSGSRMVFILLVSAWWFANSFAGLVSAAITLTSVYIIAFGLRLPSFLTNRRYPQLRLAWLGVALIAVGVGAVAYPLTLAIGLNNVHLSFIARHVPQFPPGTWVVEALGGHLAPLIALVALAAGVVGLGAVAATDAYPELWEASARLYAFRSLAASGRVFWNREAWRRLRETDPTRVSREPTSATSVSGERTPPGSFTILWKDWLALRRAPGGLRWPIVWLVAGAVAGYVAAIAAMDYSLLVVSVALAPVLNTTIVIGSQATVTLSAEIRRPIWWLSHSELRNRLLVWAASGLMRVAPPLILGEIVAGLVMRNWVLVFGAIPITLGLLMLIRAIGLACYVILPGRNDLRGPGFILRLFATYILLIPPVVTWVVVQNLTNSILAGAVGGLFFAAAETYGLVFFAALRLEENAMAFAIAEER